MTPILSKMEENVVVIIHIHGPRDIILIFKDDQDTASE